MRHKLLQELFVMLSAAARVQRKRSTTSDTVSVGHITARRNRSMEAGTPLSSATSTVMQQGNRSICSAHLRSLLSYVVLWRHIHR
jgi:hypothetical protein